MVRKARMISGLVLMTYVTTHLLNHMAGIYALQTALWGEQVFRAVWNFPPLKIIFYASLLVHVALAAWSIIRRRRFRDIRKSEAAQLLLGLAIPPLLVEHITGTAILDSTTGIQLDYTGVVSYIWVFAPDVGLVQALALVAAWGHGCIGVYGLVRFRSWYSAAAAWLFALALLVPVLALFGFAAMGREISVMIADGAAWQAMLATMELPSSEQVQALVPIRMQMYTGLAATLGLTLFLRMVLYLNSRRQRRFRVHYGSGESFSDTIGSSILDVSRAHGIPHASVCGGRGRCSTCRVQIVSGEEALDPPSPAELKVLQRVGAPPNVRLACQARPKGNVSVVPFISAATATESSRQVRGRSGEEQEIAVLFADIRGFTQISEGQLPYDLVFILNRYFQTMGTAVTQAGGHLDKFIGDGVMALFGIDEAPDVACRNAIDAARRMAQGLRVLNESLAKELSQPIRVGIGIQFGPVIIGEMGFATARSLTAIGDTVNTASRLETMTKEYGVELILSQEVADRAGLATGGYASGLVEVRGRNEPVKIILIQRAGHLSREAVEGAAPPPDPPKASPETQVPG